MPRLTNLGLGTSGSNCGFQKNICRTKYVLFNRRGRLRAKSSFYVELLLKQRAEGFTQSYKILDKEYRDFQYTVPDGDYSWFYGHALNWLEKNW